MSFVGDADRVLGNLHRSMDIISGKLKPINRDFEDFLHALNNEGFLLGLTQLIMVSVPIAEISLRANELVIALKYAEDTIEDSEIRNALSMKLKPMDKKLVSAKFYELDCKSFFGEACPSLDTIRGLIEKLGFRRLKAEELVALKCGYDISCTSLVLFQPEPHLAQSAFLFCPKEDGHCTIKNYNCNDFNRIIVVKD